MIEKEREDLDELLEAVAPDRRKFLQRVLAGTAFALPLVSSFAVSDMAAAQFPSGVTTVTVSLCTTCE